MRRMKLESARSISAIETIYFASTAHALPAVRRNGLITENWTQYTFDYHPRWSGV